MIEELEQKQSKIKEECVDWKEKCNRAALAKDVLEQEKTYLMELHNKLEGEKEDLDGEGMSTYSNLQLAFSSLSNNII